MKTADFICSSSLQLALYSSFFAIFLSLGRLWEMLRLAFIFLLLADIQID